MVKSLRLEVIDARCVVTPRRLDEKQERCEMENKLLSRDNWQQAVRDAVEELPEDIQASVGYSEPTKWVFTLNVACEPNDVRDGETSTADVVVTWWDSYRELYLEKIQEHPGIGLEE